MAVTRVPYSCLYIGLGPICNSMGASLCFKSCEDHSLLKSYNGGLWKNSYRFGPLIHMVYLIKFRVRLHVNTVSPFACVTNFLMDEALVAISMAGRDQLVKTLKTLEPDEIV